MWTAYEEVIELRKMNPDIKTGGPGEALMQALRGMGADFRNPWTVHYCDPQNVST